MVTRETVLAALSANEPDYHAASLQDETVIPFLAELRIGADTLLASKAVYLATLIEAPTVEPLLRNSIDDARPEVRIALAAGLKNMEGEGEHLRFFYERLLADEDIGVRKTVLKSISFNHAIFMQESVLRVAEEDPEIFIRNLAANVAQGLF